MKSFPVIFVFVFGVACLILMVYFHEMVHVGIYRSYGIDSKILVEGLNAVTIADEPCPLEPSDNCRLANNINEAVSYPIAPVFVFFIISTLVIVGELCSISERRGK